MELLLVMSVLATIALTTLPAVARWQNRVPLDRVAANLQIQLQSARVQAIREGQVVMALLLKKSDYSKYQSLQPDSVTTVTRTDMAFRASHSGRHLRVPCYYPDTFQLTTITDRMSGGRYGLNTEPADSLAIMFQPDGSSQDQILQIQDEHHQKLMIIVDRMTGMISLQKHHPDSAASKSLYSALPD